MMLIGPMLEYLGVDDLKGYTEQSSLESRVQNAKEVVNQVRCQQWITLHDCITLIL